MKYVVCSLLTGIALILFLSGCSKSTNSGNGDGGDEFELMQSATIDSDGGTLACDDMIMDISSNCFSGSNLVKLYQSDEDNIFGSDQVGSMFLLEGLPDDYVGTIRIAIKHSGSLNGTSYLAVGEDNPFAVSDTAHSFFSLFAAQDSSGFLVAEIPAANFGQSISSISLGGNMLGSEKNDRRVTAVTAHEIEKQTAKGNFTVIYPSDVKSTVENFLLADLEMILDSISALGFDISNLPKPVEVYISPVNDGDENRCVSFMPVYKLGAIYIDKDKLLDPVNFYDHIKGGVGRELLHYVLSTYDPLYYDQDLVSASLDRYWFHCAVSVWSESLFKSQQGLPPPSFWGDDYLFMGKRGYAPFKGLQAGNSDNSYVCYEHGCGSAGFIKYLVERYGHSLIPNTYVHLKQDYTHPLVSLLSVLPDPADDWWFSFLRDYIDGQIYKYDALGECGDHGNALGFYGNKIYDIEDAEDTLATFSCILPDLSADVIYVRLDYNDIDAGALMEVTLSPSDGNYDNLALIAYAYGVNLNTYDNDLMYIDESSEGLTIPGIRAMKDEDISYLVFVLANSRHDNLTFLGHRTVNVRIRLISPSFKYNKCEFSFLFNARMNTNGESYWSNYFSDGWTGTNGYFVGNTFYAEIDPEIHYQTGGTMEITLDPDTKNVTAFKVNTSMNYGGIVTSYDINSSGIQIPLTWFDDWLYEAQDNELSGTSVCDAMTVEYIYQVESDYTYMEDIGCQFDSYIRIHFDTDAEF